MNKKQVTAIPEGQPPIKELRGRHHRNLNTWERFDRLQRSLRPLRKGKRLKKGIHYGTG